MKLLLCKTGQSRNNKKKKSKNVQDLCTLPPNTLLTDSEDAGSMDTKGQLDFQMEGPWRYRNPESRKTGKCCGDIYAFAKM